MPSGTVSLRYLVLGLLTTEPRTGYDIKRFFKSLSWLIGSPSPGSLYPLLHTLLQEGLVTVEVVPGIDKPPRKIYRLTEAGRESLQHWVELPAAADTSLKAFVKRLLLADSLPAARLILQFQQRRALVADQRADLEQAVQTPDEEMGLGQQLSLDYGLAMANAELAWLDGILDQLSQQPPP